MTDGLQRPPEVEALESSSGGLDASQREVFSLASLPVGARLILRCRKDWRDATVVAISFEQVVLCVTSPKGRTYRVRRPADSPLSFDGAIPVLGDGHWRVGRARYDSRW